MWVYYETDGDSGWYAVKLFSTQTFALQYKTEKDNAYGNITEVQVDEIAKPLPYENVKCPECGSDMISRKGTYGVFWGCKRYPNCRGTRDSQGRSKAEQRADRERDNQEVEHQEGFPFKRS